jgi:hypothetical protein
LRRREGLQLRRDKPALAVFNATIAKLQSNARHLPEVGARGLTGENQSDRRQLL